MHTDITQGHVTGTPQRLLQLEGLVVMLLAAYAYSLFGAGWGWFAATFLAPDLAMLGYLGGRKLGAFAYNATHSYQLPAGLLAWGAYAASDLALSIGLIWVAHIGFDRALGYGLKYAKGFGFTHLGTKGKARRQMEMAA